MNINESVRACERAARVNTCHTSNAVWHVLLAQLSRDKSEIHYLRANSDIGSASKRRADCARREAQAREKSWKRCCQVYSGPLFSNHNTVPNTSQVDALRLWKEKDSNILNRHRDKLPKWKKHYHEFTLSEINYPSYLECRYWLSQSLCA